MTCLEHLLVSGTVRGAVTPSLTASLGNRYTCILLQVAKLKTGKGDDLTNVPKQGSGGAGICGP
jgi:hypothetical protein